MPNERSSDPVKTMIPYSTSLKNQVFLVSAPKLPPDSTLAVFRSGLRESPRVFWRAFGRLLATLTGALVNKIRFVNALEGVGAFSCSHMVSGDASGWYFGQFLVVRRSTFSVLGENN